MRRFLQLVLVSATLAAVGFAAQNNAAPNPAVAELHAAEAACDQVVRTLVIESGVEHVTPTHAVRIDGYGVVLVTDVNLAPLPLMFGFGGQMNKKELQTVHEAKLKKTAAIRPVVVRLLEAAAAKLASVPPEQTIVLKVNFYSADFEDHTGLPESLTIAVLKSDVMALSQLDAAKKNDAAATLPMRMDHK